MELKDTIPMMLSDDYRERFKAEYFQVKIRREKLRAILKKEKAGTLEFKLSSSLWSLQQQEWHMTSYLCALKHRAHEENINLEG